MAQPPKWVIEFYQDARGRRPVEMWLDGLDVGDRARVRRMLNLLAAFGTQLGMPYSRHLRGKIWELRVAAGRRDYRVLYFAFVGQRFVLLHAFAKQTAKTPARELEMAEQRMADHQARYQEGG